MMRIVSWNIRAGGGKRVRGILAQLLAWRPDVIGLAEFRGTYPSQWLAAELAAAGYHSQLTSINSKLPAKNALLLASKESLQIIAAPKMPKNRERWLLARVATQPGLTLGMMHIPNHTTPALKYPFMAALLKMAEAWKLGPGLLIGDSNCSKRDLDEENPLGPGFHREHDWIVGMGQRGWVDAFRHVHGKRREYSWYSHRNNGFRLDQAFCSPQLVPAISGFRHAWGLNPEQPDRRQGLSDHAALIIDLASSEAELQSCLKQHHNNHSGGQR
jgi:exodeoxyribonuclease-3